MKIRWLDSNLKDNEVSASTAYVELDDIFIMSGIVAVKMLKHVQHYQGRFTDEEYWTLKELILSRDIDNLLIVFQVLTDRD